MQSLDLMTYMAFVEMKHVEYALTQCIIRQKNRECRNPTMLEGNIRFQNLQ